MHARLKRKVRLRSEAFAERCDALGLSTWDSRAKHIGVSAAAMSRLSKGGAASVNAITGIVETFGATEAFSELLEVHA